VPESFEDIVKRFDDERETRSLRDFGADRGPPRLPESWTATAITVLMQG
jgi:hypothetical protein